MEMTKEMELGLETLFARNLGLRAQLSTYGALLNLMEIGEIVTPTELCEKYAKKKEEFIAAGKTSQDLLKIGYKLNVNPSYAGCWAKAMERAGYIKREKKSIEPYVIKVSTWGWSEDLKDYSEIEKEITIDTQTYYTKIK